MSYQIGQIQDTNLVSTDYFTPINVNKHTDIIVSSASPLVADIEFREIGLSSTNSNWMKSQNNYYLNFTIDRYEQGHFKDNSDPTVDTMNFVLCLLVDGSIPGEYILGQVIDTFTVLPYRPGETEEANKKANFEVIFTPVRDDITRIGFIRTKKRYDYIGSGPERTLLLTVNSYGIISNLLPKVPGIGNHKADKIGIQSKPGLLVCINGENIRVGKSGVYEINNGLQISFFGTAAIGEHFLLDCAWDA